MGAEGSGLVAPVYILVLFWVQESVAMYTYSFFLGLLLVESLSKGISHVGAVNGEF